MKLHYEREGFAKDVLCAGKLVTTKLFVRKNLCHHKLNHHLINLNNQHQPHPQIHKFGHLHNLHQPHQHIHNLCHLHNLPINHPTKSNNTRSPQHQSISANNRRVHINTHQATNLSHL